MKIEFEPEDRQALVQDIINQLKPLLMSNKCKNNAEDKIFTVKELAEYLKVDTSWVYKQIYSNKLPYIKTGKYRRFKKSAIDKYLEMHSVKKLLF